MISGLLFVKNSSEQIIFSRLCCRDYLCRTNMGSFPHDHILPTKDSGLKKKVQVTQMFDEIASRYDFMNHFLSAGIDKAWRRKAIKKLKRDNPKKILDVATGTADMALLACRILKPEKVVGIDLSEKMLEAGRKKIEKEGFKNLIELQISDSEAINFPENSFDAVIAAFGVRNFENLEKGLSEMFRVLKPGSRLVILEFSKPKLKPVRAFFKVYMKLAAPRLAQWFRQNKESYQYLFESANSFPDRRQFVEILKEVGFSETGYQPLSLGICCIYSGRKL